MPKAAMRTFLFADLRDYTGFVETRGDAATAKLLRAFRSIVRAAVAATRGAEVQTEGDSFYVVFRTPGNAIRCALGVQERAATHARRHPELELRIGIGINTGEAVEHDRGFVGSAVIVAARLAQQAPAGEILVTDTVRSLVRTAGLAPLRDGGAWTLKGVAEPVRVFHVERAASSPRRSLAPALGLPAMLAAPGRPSRGLVVCPELVQRETALAALLEHVGAAAGGENRIVAVSGEGGVGKSRLVREVARLAHRDGLYVFGGRSHDSGPPYEPFVAALRPYAHARGIEILKRLLGPLVVELRRLLPELAVAETEREQGAPDDERRERFLRTIHLLLEDAAAQRPVLLVLEDFHAADVASRDLLAYLASGLRAGICIVLIYRDEEAGPAHPLRALLGELDRERRLARVELAPLDASGVARMTAALLPGRDTAALARAVHERSEGVPFYVEELLKTALDDPEAKPDRLALPRTIADSVRLRVGRLVQARGPGVADLLEAIAVAAVPIGYDMLVRLADRPEPEAAADLAATIEAQLLERPPATSELYQFRHSLTREAIEAAIPPARKRRLHARVASALESLGDTGPRAALLARHFAAAGERAKALSYARTGAENAVRVGAYGGAIDLLRDAVVMASGTNEEPAVLEELAVALQAAGRAAEAEEAVESARHLALLARDAERLARLDIRLAAVLQMQGRRPEAIAAVRRAIAALEAHPNETLAEATLAQAELAWGDRESAQAASLARRALAIARPRRARAVMVGALTVLGAALVRSGDGAGIDRLREAIQLGLDHGLNGETVNAYQELSAAQLFRGSDAEARSSAERGIELARARGLEFAQARLLSHLTTILVNQGRYRDARVAAEQAVAIARPDTIAADTAKIALANVMTNQGEYARALAIYDQIADRVERNEPDRQMVFFANRAQALLGLERLDDAAASARRAVDITLANPKTGMTAFLNAADVAEARRDSAEARVLASEFERYFAGRDTPAIRAVRAELAGITELCEGRDPREHFAAAAASYDALGASVRAGYRRACAALARLTDVRERQAARREIDSIRADLIERGALRYVASIDAAMDRPAAAATAWAGGLTQRELRAATLISRGFTDRRLARELGLSAPAVATLVRKVLVKLGVASRSQVASWIVEQQAAVSGH